jgi:hypothetical protein
MYRAGLLAVLLLAAAVLAGNVTLTCKAVSNYTVDTTDSISVRFSFWSIAPVIYVPPPWWPVIPFGIIIDYHPSYTSLYALALSVQLDKSPNFNVTLNHYAPDQSWWIDRYRCVYNRSGNVEERYYDVVAQTPQRTTTTVTFTVPDTAARYSASTTVRVSKPLSGSYCSSTPTIKSWPN